MVWTEIGKLAVALGIGLLLGAEREKSKGGKKDPIPAGIRTFTLISLLGGVSTLFENPIFLVVAAVFLGALIVVSYVASSKRDRGLTTEVAMMVAFVLGALSQKQPELAAGLGVAVAILLVARPKLHRFVKEVLSEAELQDAIVFAAAALVVLPILPNQGFGPLEFLNPHRVWLLVVILIGINGLGHIAMRALGAKLGLPISGFFSGFVSSSATIAAMGEKASHHPALLRPAVAAATLSSFATVLQLAIVLAVVDLEVLRAMTLPLLLAGAAAVGYGIFYTVRLKKQPSGAESVLARGHAFSLKSALFFAFLVTAILFLTSAIRHWMGSTGLVLAAALGGFADVHAATISVLSTGMFPGGSSSVTLFAIAAAFTTNSISKSFFALTRGPRAYAWQVIPGLVLILGGLWLGLLLAGLFEG